MDDRSYLGDYSNFLTQKRYKLLWLALVALFLISGAVGHDPWWKKGETYSFGIIYHFYLTDTWLVPTNAGVPFMEKPPLYYWTAHIFCDLLGLFLPLHDAARLTSVFYTVIATFFLWKTALILFGDYEKKQSLACMTVALFLGNYGTALFSHAMITDVALTAGAAITIYGLSVLYKLPKQWKYAGIWTGIGFGMTFLSKGLVIPIVLALSWLIIVLLLPGIKNKTNIRAVILASAVAAPFFLIWPLLLYQHSPALFMEWFWDNNIGRFLGFSVNKLGAKNHRCNLLLILPANSFPIFPLACIEVFLGRKEWRRTEYLLPLIVSLVGILILFCSASFRNIYIMPLFPIFSLLGVQGLMRLSEKFHVQWNKVARLLFTLAVIVVWIVWLNLRFSLPPHFLPSLANLFSDTLSPVLVLHETQYIAIATAAVVTLFWLASLRIRGNTAFDTASIFMFGTITLWCTGHTLLLPWINEVKSYRPTIRELEHFVSNSPYADKCMGNYHLNENMGPMVEYFMGKDKPLPVVIDIYNSECPLVLTEDPSGKYLPANWKLVWNNKDLGLYERVK